MAGHPPTPGTPAFLLAGPKSVPDLPDFERGESFVDTVRKLCLYFTKVVDTPHTFEQMRLTSMGQQLHPLIKYLSNEVHHPAIVAALLTLKWYFNASEPDDRGLNDARGYACEIVAWRFLSHLSERERIDYLLYELPGNEVDGNNQAIDMEDGLAHAGSQMRAAAEATVPLLQETARAGSGRTRKEKEGDDPTASFVGLNALEIAAVADAKKFLAQKAVQKIINDLWSGHIILWESLDTYSIKKARIYNKRLADPYCRLRVPKYQKVFEALFFASLLALYYSVLVERNPSRIMATEVLLNIWIAAFAYDEFSEFQDAGRLFYNTDFWSIWDLGIIGIGVAYLITRIVGLVHADMRITDIAFDILSLEALFLIPRICSLLSLHPYFGTLIPCLKEMTKDFVKFLSIVIILYLGFLTTFTLLARDSFTLPEMFWILVKVFFGSSYLGFDAMRDISPILGPPLMLIFVCMTNILLITVVISLLGNRLAKVLDNARENYLFISAVFVLEASTSNRLTYFYPPLNLLPLFLFRPLRLVLSSAQLRTGRIILLRATHFPFVLAIQTYEHFYTGAAATQARSSGYPSLGTLTAPSRPRLNKLHASKIPSSTGIHSSSSLEIPTRTAYQAKLDPESHSTRRSRAVGGGHVAIQEPEGRGRRSSSLAAESRLSSTPSSALPSPSPSSALFARARPAKTANTESDGGSDIDQSSSPNTTRAETVPASDFRPSSPSPRDSCEEPRSSSLISTTGAQRGDASRGPADGALLSSSPSFLERITTPINIATVKNGAPEPTTSIITPTPAAAVTAATPTSLAQLEQAVKALSLQIEQLTAMVAEQPKRLS